MIKDKPIGHTLLLVLALVAFLVAGAGAEKMNAQRLPAPTVPESQREALPVAPT